MFFYVYICTQYHHKINNAYLAVTWVYSPDHCTIGVFIIIGGAFIIKSRGIFLCPMPPMDNQSGIFFQFALMIFGASI